MEEPRPTHQTRKPRKRASIACQSCNTKRVKCDASLVGLPCSNCQRHGRGRDCRLIESKRGRKKHAYARRDVAVENPAKELQREQDLLPDGDRPAKSDHDLENRTPERINVGSSTAADEQIEPQNDDGLVQCDLNLEHGAHEAGNLGATYEEKDLLQLQGAFEIPNSKVCLEFFKAYFNHVAPHYPILDRKGFIFQYAVPQRPPSWLLLQAVLFMAAGHCEESALKEAGFTSRHDARLTLFKRAKALYDADHEQDKVTIVQAVFLMSFWWKSPVDLRDPWHWLGIAINTALTIGMHRSTNDSGMSLKDQRLWKRIWWSLFAEDKHAAAALDRPVHIRLNDCDIEQLESSDFEGEPYGFGNSFNFGLPKVIMAYPICLASLSKIVERIIEKSTQPPRSQNNSLELCEGMLEVWEAGLPDVLRLNNPESDRTIWPSMMHIAACWFRILAHRTRTSKGSSTRQDDTHENAMRAANQMIRIVEDLLASGRIQHCAMHIIPALFTAMNVFNTKVRSADKVSQQLAYVKIKTCMIAFRELQGTWPVSGWIFLLLAKILRDIRGEDNLEPGQTGQRESNRRKSGEIQGTAAGHSSRFQSQAGRQFQIARNDLQLGLIPVQSEGATGYNTPDATLQERVVVPNNESYSTPPNLSTGWSSVRDEDLWLMSQHDLLGDMPRVNNLEGSPGTRWT